MMPDPAQMRGGLAPGAMLGGDRLWNSARNTRKMGNVIPDFSGEDDERAYDP
jgi:hypothetical protein